MRVFSLETLRGQKKYSDTLILLERSFLANFPLDLIANDDFHQKFLLDLTIVLFIFENFDMTLQKKPTTLIKHRVNYMIII